jgi:putative photosynthetic complex assembly protein
MALSENSPTPPTGRKPTSGFPRPPLIAAGGLVCFALLAATVGRISGAGNQQPVSTPIAERDLRFEDRADGAVLVYDAHANPSDQGATPIEVAVGQNGFLRGTLRGFARTRHADGIGAAAPFHLTAWADGRLTLTDPSTGRHADLEAFGIDNVRVFANFLTLPTKTAANDTTSFTR